MSKKNYGLLTAITMIVGIVVGSGIFFKSSSILKATDGNIFLSILVFLIGAIAIVFGSLTLSELASKTDKPGGVVTYFEEFTNKGLASGFGWFQTFIYTPTIIVVVSWVSSVYIGLLFNLNLEIEGQILIGAGFMTLLFLCNTLSAKVGGFTQNIATFIKFLPLIAIGVAGIFFVDPQIFTTNNPHFSTAIESTAWLAALAPMAFSYDGWILTTSISHEIKDAKRNTPKALIIAPIIILSIYLFYFLGITNMLGVETILSMSDVDAVMLAAQKIFGGFGAKLILVFVIVSILGTVNGCILSVIRMPYSLATKNMIFKSNVFVKENKKNNMPVNSAICAFVTCLVWYILHYLTLKFNILPRSDISEIAIITSYVMYTVLYVKVMILKKKGEITSVVKGLIFPILGTLGAFIILIGGLFMNFTVYLLYIIGCLLVVAAGFVSYKHKEKNNKTNNLMKE